MVYCACLMRKITDDLAVFVATIPAAGFESVFVVLLYLERGVEG